MDAKREFLRIDWVGLQAQNADVGVIAWLSVPERGLNYPGISRSYQ